MISLMGPSLYDLIKEYNISIDLFSLYNIAIDLISQLEVIPESKLLHGDIKEKNICYGNLSNLGCTHKRKIGFLDFGNSMIYKMNNKIIDFQKNNKNVCTREYSSLEALNGNTFSRKDDLESVLYFLIKIYSKNLSWNKLENVIQKNDYIIEKDSRSKKFRKKSNCH